MGEKSFFKPRNHILATLYESIIDAFRKAARWVRDLPGNLDAFVKNPSAALRVNPAPLDNNPALGIQGNTPDIGKGNLF
jgi:hypothetical protein